MKCALCELNDTDEDSHIVPKLVFRWLKRESVTGHLRGTADPNLRTQDGPKIKLLCPDCEDQFSKYESEFARRVFHPIHKEKKNDWSFGYDQWFHDFAVSVSWRSLEFLCRNEGSEELPFGHQVIAEKALETWRQYLSNQRIDTGKHIQHLIIMDDIASYSGPMDIDDLNTYINRGIDFNTVHSPEEGYVFTKMGRVVIVGVLINETREPSWSGTEIKKSGGTYSLIEFGVSGCFFTFLETAIKELEKARSELSEKQADVMVNALFRKFGITKQ